MCRGGTSVKLCTLPVTPFPSLRIEVFGAGESSGKKREKSEHLRYTRRLPPTPLKEGGKKEALLFEGGRGESLFPLVTPPFLML
jgi:hypothetical protein